MESPPVGFSSTGSETTTSPALNEPDVSSTSQQNSWPNTVSAPLRIWVMPPSRVVRSITWS